MGNISAYVEPAYAKVNLNLHIRGFKPSGYCIVDSLVVFADIADVITLKPHHTFSLDIVGPMADDLKKSIPLKSSLHNNIIAKTLDCFSRVTGIDQKFSITLEKNIPIASGLGGGSADAAAVLRILKKLFPNVAQLQILQVCKILGSDISACYYQKPLRMQGTGHDLHFFSLPCEMSILLINPRIACSTQEIFNAYKIAHKKKHATFNTKFPENWIHRIKNRHDFFTLISSLNNDLYPFTAKKIPELNVIMQNLKRLDDCVYVNMSGSGATCFALFDSLPKAHQASLELQYVYPDYWIRSLSVKNLTYIPVHHV